MNIDSLVFGNASNIQCNYLSQDSYLDAVFSGLTSVSFPPNSSQESAKEISDIMEYITELSGDAGSQNRFFLYDSNINGAWLAYFNKKQIKSEDIAPTLDAIFRDVQPVISKLKFYFQRPRPYQLAYYHKFRLFPFDSVSALSPSYPCGQAILGEMFAEILGNKYPDHYNALKKIAVDIKMSRLFMGLNYQSDIDFSGLVVEKMLQVKELKLKYRI